MGEVHDLGMPDRCHGCGSSDVATGGIQNMGTRTYVVDGEEQTFEVLEYADLTKTCHACGMKARTVITPTEESHEAFALGGTANPEPPAIKAGDAVWQGRVRRDAVLDVSGAPLGEDHIFIRINAKERESA